MKWFKLFLMQEFKLNKFLLKLKVLFSFEANFLLIVFWDDLNLIYSFLVEMTQWGLIFLFQLLNLFLYFINAILNVVDDAVFLCLEFVEIFKMFFLSIFW